MVVDFHVAVIGLVLLIITPAAATAVVFAALAAVLCVDHTVDIRVMD